MYCFFCKKLDFYPYVLNGWSVNDFFYKEGTEKIESVARPAAVEGLVAGVGAVRTLVANLLVGDALLRVVLAHPLSLGAGGGCAPNLRVISKSS